MLQLHSWTSAPWKSNTKYMVQSKSLLITIGEVKLCVVQEWVTFFFVAKTRTRHLSFAQMLEMSALHGVKHLLSVRQKVTPKTILTRYDWGCLVSVGNSWNFGSQEVWLDQWWFSPDSKAVHPLELGQLLISLDTSANLYLCRSSSSWT